MNNLNLKTMFPSFTLNEDKFYPQLKEIEDANPKHSRIHRDQSCLQFEANDVTFLIQGCLSKGGLPKFVGVVQSLKNGREVSFETPEFDLAVDALQALAFEVAGGLSNVHLDKEEQEESDSLDVYASFKEMLATVAQTPESKSEVSRLISFYRKNPVLKDHLGISLRRYLDLAATRHDEFFYTRVAFIKLCAKASIKIDRSIVGTEF